MPWLTQYCRRHFLGDAKVYIETDKVLNIIFYFVIPEVRFYTCPVNQLPTVWQTSFTRTQISYTRNQLHSRTINLCSSWPHHQQPRLLDGQCPILVVSTKISFICFFFILGWMFAIRLLPFTVCFIMNTSSLPHLTGNSWTDFIPFCWLLTSFDSKISGATPF